MIPVALFDEMMPGSNKPRLRTTGATAQSELIRVASGLKCQATFIASGFQPIVTTFIILRMLQDRDDSVYTSVQKKHNGFTMPKT